MFGNQYAGGIVGYNVREIYNSYNTGNITNGTYVGGICSTVESKIVNCYNTAPVFTSNGYLGGLVSTISSEVTIANSFNTSSCTSNLFYDNCSGIVDTNNGTLKIYNCYSLGNSHITLWRGEIYKYIPSGLVGLNSGTIDLNRCYYLKTDKIVKALPNVEDNTLDVTALNNKSEITAEILNKNISEIEHDDTWVPWIQKGEYPVLDFSTIKGFPKQ